jgi:hypothetical protein
MTYRTIFTGQDTQTYNIRHAGPWYICVLYHRSLFVCYLSQSRNYKAIIPLYVTSFIMQQICRIVLVLTYTSSFIFFRWWKANTARWSSAVVTFLLTCLHTCLIEFVKDYVVIKSVDLSRFMRIKNLESWISVYTNHPSYCTHISTAVVNRQKTNVSDQKHGMTRKCQDNTWVSISYTKH